MSFLDALWWDELTIHSTLRLGRTLKKTKVWCFVGFWIPAFAGMTDRGHLALVEGGWIPAFAGMTPRVVRQDEPKATGVLRSCPKTHFGAC